VVIEVGGQSQQVGAVRELRVEDGIVVTALVVWDMAMKNI
jgi:hypothetical protein